MCSIESASARIAPEPVNASYGRWVRNAVLIPWDVAASYLSPYLWKTPETEKSVRAIDVYGSAAQRTLSSMGQISTSAVVSFGESLRSLLMVSDFLFQRQNDSFLLDSKKNLQKKFVAIPVVISTVYNHLVTFFIDTENNRIEFYDPQGYTIRDRAGQSLLAHKNMDLETFYENIFPFYGDEKTELYENTVKHQCDVTSCGVYVCDYYKRRLNGETPEHISANRKSFAEVNTSLRSDMINNILSRSLNK